MPQKKTERQRRITAVKSRLLAYRQREMDIEYQMERLERYKTKIMTAEPLVMTGMPPGGAPPGDRMSEYVARKEELEEKIQQQRERQNSEKEHLESLLENMASARERAVIRMRYFDLCGWEEVTEALFGHAEDYDDRLESYLRHTHKIHVSALQNLALEMERREQG